MKKLLIVSDDPNLTSGLGRIVRELSSMFLEKFELRVAGWHRLPMAHSFPFFIYELDKGTTKTQNDLNIALADFKPDIILLIGDLWDFAILQEVIPLYKERKPDTKVIGWITVDGEWLHGSWAPIVHLMDGIATFSYFGQAEIERLSKVRPEVIYPGVDHNVFLKRDVELQTSKELKFNPKNTFIVLDLNQNTDRKNFPALIEAFAEFAKEKPDAFLFLATDPTDLHGFDLWDIINQLGISKKVAITRDIFPAGGVPDTKLSFIYNLASVFVSTAIGEGYGLPFNEAMACELPVLATGYSTPIELLADGRGKTIEVATYFRGEYGIQRAMVSKRDLVKQLEILYADWKTKDRPILTEYSRKAKEFIKSMTWKNTFFQLMSLIEKTTEEKKRSWIKKDVVVKDIRLLMVIPSWGKNCGIAEYTASLVEAIRRKDLSVMVYPSADLETLTGFVKEHNLNTIHYQHEFSFWQDRIKLERSLEKLNEMGVKTVVTMHSFCKGLSSYNMMVSQFANKVIVHALPFKQEYEMMTNLPGEFKPTLPNIEHIPMGCEFPIPLNEDEVKETRRHLNIENKSPIIGSFGFLRDQKGYNELVLAVKELRTKYPKICCLIYAPPHEFGSKFYDNEFFKFIEREKLEDMVLVIRDYSEKEKMLRILQSADLFVLNYKDSPQGGGISAAVKTLMRTQRPIIVADSIAFRDLDREVLKITKPNIQKIAGTIDQVWMNEVLKTKLVEQANLFLNNNIWDKIATKHLRIYGD